MCERCSVISTCVENRCSDELLCATCEARRASLEAAARATHQQLAVNPLVNPPISPSINREISLAATARAPAASAPYEEMEEMESSIWIVPESQFDPISRNDIAEGHSTDVPRDVDLGAVNNSDGIHGNNDNDDSAHDLRPKQQRKTKGKPPKPAATNIPATGPANDSSPQHCIDGCKHGSQNGGDMIRCCLCARWYHTKCLDLPDDEASGCVSPVEI